MKTCNVCGETKPLDKFYKNKSYKSGVENRCNVCRAQWFREYRARDKEAYNKTRRETRGSTRWENIRKKFKIGESEYDEILKSQGGVCAICRLPHERFHIDHDHVTNKIRGILCPSCNTGLGKLGDTLDGLMRAVRYLEETSG